MLTYIFTHITVYIIIHLYIYLLFHLLIYLVVIYFHSLFIRSWHEFVMDGAACDDDEASASRGDACPLRDALWQKLCDKPLLYHCRDFLSPEECQTILRAVYRSAPVALSSGGQAKLRIDLDLKRLEAACNSADEAEEFAVLRRIERRVEALSGVRSHKNEEPWAVHFTPLPSPEDEASGDSSSCCKTRMSLGIHVDTNNCRDRRWVTFIAYGRSRKGGSLRTTLSISEKRFARKGGSVPTTI